MPLIVRKFTLPQQPLGGDDSNLLHLPRYIGWSAKREGEREGEGEEIERTRSRGGLVWAGPVVGGILW